MEIAREREWERRESQEKKEHKEGRDVPANLPGQGELVGQGRVTQQSGFPGFPTYDCAFLCREGVLQGKLNHVSRGAHVMASRNAGTEGKLTESASVDKTPTTGPHWSGSVISQLEEFLMKI